MTGEPLRTCFCCFISHTLYLTMEHPRAVKNQNKREVEAYVAWENCNERQRRDSEKNYYHTQHLFSAPRKADGVSKKGTESVARLLGSGERWYSRVPLPRMREDLYQETHHGEPFLRVRYILESIIGGVSTVHISMWSHMLWLVQPSSFLCRHQLNLESLWGSLTTPVIGGPLCPSCP